MNTASEHASLASASWIECSYEIHFAEHADLKHIQDMRTKGQQVKERVACVPSGKLRVTPRFLECKDGTGSPFNWSLTLIEKVVGSDGTILWRNNGGPA